MAVGVVCAIAVAAGASALAVGGGAASTGLGGFSSLRFAAASISHGCAKEAGSGLPPLIVPVAPSSGVTVWRRVSGRPLVYAAAGYVADRAGTKWVAGAFSSRGLRISLAHTQPVALWPCREPVVFYNNGQLWMTALATQPGRPKPVALGRVPVNALFDSQGRLVEFGATTIHYVGGRTITPTGFPPGWQIRRIVPSPRQRSVFLAEVEKPGCTEVDDGRLYVISPHGSSQLASYDACGNPPLAGWSRNGSQIFWTTAGRSLPVVTRLDLRGASGGASRRLTAIQGDVLYALWSPDGSRIAYSYRDGLVVQVGVVNIATGAAHALTHIRWKPTPPPYQPPYARLIGWSPNSKSVLILHALPNARRVTIDAMAATGGRPRILIRLKPAR